MPSRPPRPCAKPGCAGLVTSGRFCEKHQKHIRNSSANYQHLYGRKWREASRAFLASGDNAWCANCGSIAQCVDHIEPHRGDLAAFWNIDNWQPLCFRCHNTKTAREDGGFGCTKRGEGG